MSEFEEVNVKVECILTSIKNENEIITENTWEDQQRPSEQKYDIPKWKFTDCFENPSTSKSKVSGTTKFTSFKRPLPNFNFQDFGDRTTRRSLFRKVKKWIPKTRLGRMVKGKKYTSIKQIRRSEFSIEECEIVKYLLGSTLNVDVICIKPIFDSSGISRGFISFVGVGDKNGYFGYSVKYNSCRNISVHEATDRALLDIDLVKRFAYKFASKTYYTVAFKVIASSGDITVKLLPALNNQGITTENEIIKRMLSLAGIDSCIVEVKGTDNFIGNVALATYKALQQLSDIE